MIKKKLCSFIKLKCRLSMRILKITCGLLRLGEQIKVSDLRMRPNRGTESLNSWRLRRLSRKSSRRGANGLPPARHRLSLIWFTSEHILCKLTIKIYPNFRRMLNFEIGLLFSARFFPAYHLIYLALLYERWWNFDWSFEKWDADLISLFFNARPVTYAFFYFISQTNIDLFWQLYFIYHFCASSTIDCWYSWLYKQLRNKLDLWYW